MVRLQPKATARPNEARDVLRGRLEAQLDRQWPHESVTRDPASDRAAEPPRGVLRWLLGLPVVLYRAHLGFLLGQRFLVLVHEGRRTGRGHETPLEVVRYDRSTEEATVVAGWGRKTARLYNVEAGLAQEVWIGRARYEPVVRRLGLDEAVAVLERYERHSWLPRSLVWAVLSRLLGWRYDGTPQAHRRAAEQLPIVAFRPKT